MRLLLPALRGNDPLGFLAAIGLSALSDQGEIPPLRLAWEVRSGLAAVTESDFETLRELSAALRGAFDRLGERDAVLPGVDADFPVRKQGSGSDPMRMARSEMARFYRDADRTWLEDGDPWWARWLVALAAQTAIKDPKREDVELTPFYAPTGQMALRTSIFEKTMEAVEAIDGPGDALTRWQRTSYDGANFDLRAKRDAGVTTSGRPDNQGAPSATWLAAMAIRFFPLVDTGSRARAVGWHHNVRLYPGYTNRSLVWPIWEPALDPPAVRALVAHPALRLQCRGGRLHPSDPNGLAALGVRRVYGASRRTLQQGDGPLGPAELVWEPSRSRPARR